MERSSRRFEEEDAAVVWIKEDTVAMWVEENATVVWIPYLGEELHIYNGGETLYS